MAKILPKNMGVIIRTSAKGKSEAVLAKDVENLKQRWNKIEELKEKAENCPQLIEKSDSVAEKMLIDLSNKEIRSVITNDKEEKERIESLAQKLELTKLKIKLEESGNLETEYDLESQLAKAESRKIWLKCGGFITIDKTEALTAIDVNSGKYIGTKNLEQTVFTVNKEASLEIAKQLKLKDIGGIIIIDYIDMDNKENKEKIEKLLKEELKKDRSKTQVLGFTKLNLLEMTRKHIC